MGDPFSHLRAKRETEEARKRQAEALARIPVEQYDGMVQEAFDS